MYTREVKTKQADSIRKILEKNLKKAQNNKIENIAGSV